MELEAYWGVGPKTRDLLREQLGDETAIEAIESGDVGALLGAGLPRGRATRILRRAHGGEALSVLATPDSREVYKELLALASDHAVTDDAADRIRILTPLESREAMDERLERVVAARDAWASLPDRRREAVLEAFETGEEAGDLAAVETARALANLELEAAVFEPVTALDVDALGDARESLRGLRDADGVGEGADERLDELRERLGRVEDLAAAPAELLAAVQEEVRDASGFRAALRGQLRDRAEVELERIEQAMPDEATDAPLFVERTLDALATELREAVETREREVRTDLEARLERVEGTVADAREAVESTALELSLGRFALANDLRRPRLRADRALAVERARNLSLLAAGESVQPVTYAVGAAAEATVENRELDEVTDGGHGLADVPDGDRVAVLTGANSGGKTTLLETLCQVQLLAQMGLPVPAERATVGVVDDVVFHRRHASFNAGVLESTLRTVVPPVTAEGRTLMLVDEFEAITEPGRAADLLGALVELTVENDALGVFVTHLADDLEPLPDPARIDGIFAEGLTPELELEVDYQPQFDTLGRSTPEFIVSRLVANADDRTERTGYERLAEAVGEAAVQRTLADARWTE